MPSFLNHLGDAAKSTIALVAYVVVVAAWCFRAWMSSLPQRKAKQILSLYKTDSERTRALAELLGTRPPAGLAAQDLLAWTAIQTKQRSRILLVVAYLCTLLATITIVGMALFHPQGDDPNKPPVLIKSQPEKPSAR